MITNKIICRNLKGRHIDEELKITKHTAWLFIEEDYDILFGTSDMTLTCDIRVYKKFPCITMASHSSTKPK